MSVCCFGQEIYYSHGIVRLNIPHMLGLLTMIEMYNRHADIAIELYLQQLFVSAKKKQMT